MGQMVNGAVVARPESRGGDSEAERSMSEELREGGQGVMPLIDDYYTPDVEDLFDELAGR